MTTKKLIKKNLIFQVAMKTNLSKAEVSSVLESAISQIKLALSKGDSVTLVGFGTFTAGIRKGRVVTVPLTRKKVKIPSKKVIKFEAGKAFKSSVNSN